MAPPKKKELVIGHPSFASSAIQLKDQGTSIQIAFRCDP
jgi:uncharacterized protein (DUF2141 family)